MLGRKMKKGLAAAVVLGMVMSVLTGCGGTRTEKTKSEAQKDQFIYTLVSVPLQGVEGTMEQMQAVEEQVYFSTIEYADDRAIYRCYYSGIEDTLKGSKLAEFSLNDADCFGGFGITDEGNLMYCRTIQNEKDGSNQILIDKTDDRGKTILSQDITKDVGADAQIYYGNFYVMRDCFAVLYGTSVFTFDLDGKVKNQWSVDENLLYMISAGDDRLACVFQGEERNLLVSMLDVSSGKMTEKTVLENSVHLGSSDNLYRGFGDYSFCFADEYFLYGYTDATHEVSKIMDFTKSYLNVTSIYSIAGLQDGRLLVATDEDPCMLGTKSEQVQDKIVLTLGGEMSSDMIQDIVMEFNRFNDQYTVVLDEDMGNADYTEKFPLKLLTGDVPDIICMDRYSVDKYARRGVIEDLTSFYERDMDTLNLSSSIAEALKQDGKYYIVVPFVQMDTMIARADTVGNAPGWTIEDMMAVIQKQKGKRRAFDKMLKSQILQTILYMQLSDYMDWETGTCDFECQSFANILTLCEQEGEDKLEEQVISGNGEDQIRDGSRFLIASQLSLNNIQMLRNTFGDQLCVIGYPCSEKNGTRLIKAASYAISSQCKHQEGAWEFLKMLYSTKCQVKYCGADQMPVNQEAFEMYKKEYTTTQAYTDVFGREIVPRDIVRFDGEIMMQEGPLTDAEVKMVEDIYNNTNPIVEYDQDAYAIIEEEAQAYFHGDKTVEEACKYIQNRVSTYMSENR